MTKSSNSLGRLTIPPSLLHRHQTAEFIFGMSPRLARNRRRMMQKMDLLSCYLFTVDTRTDRPTSVGVPMRKRGSTWQPLQKITSSWSGSQARTFTVEMRFRYSPRSWSRDYDCTIVLDGFVLDIDILHKATYCTQKRQALDCTLQCP